MDDGPAGYAMTEIALALAMSFFCLLVLTLVSTGSPESESAAVRIEALAVAPASAANGDVAASDRLVVLHAGRFLDAGRQPVDPAGLTGGGRIVLAVDPDLPMTEILAARRRIAAADIVLTPLDPDWLAALAAGEAR